MQRYLTNQSAIERHTLEDWAAAVSGHHRDSIRNLMATLHADVIDSQSVFRLIHDMVGNNNNLKSIGFATVRHNYREAI